MTSAEKSRKPTIRLEKGLYDLQTYVILTIVSLLSPIDR